MVTGPSGAAVSGYGVVMADAESTNRGEGLTFTADQPIEHLATATMPGALPACGQEFSGVGTTSVRCLGDTPGGEAVEEVLLYADSPSTASIGFIDRTDNAVQGVAFGLLTAKVGMSKTVEDRTDPDDAFDIAIDDGAGNRVGEASTGTGDTAAIEPVTVLAGLAGRPYAFSETAANGTGLSSYTTAWSCTNHGEADPDLPTGGSANDIPVNVGDDIQCAVTNTGTPPTGPTAGPSGPGDSPSPDGEALPQTGASAFRLALVAVLAAAAGAVGIVIARRARRTTW